MAAGAKTGGRKKGTPNKASVAKASEVAASGLTPLDYMLSLLRNECNSAEVRFEAAKQAAPYCHPKLAAATWDLGADTIDALAGIIAQRRQRVAEAANGD